MANRSELKLNDIVVSRVEDGHHLLIVTAMPDDRISLVYRGDGWNVQYAVARGARLAEGKGGNLWYTSDDLDTLEYWNHSDRTEKGGQTLFLRFS